MKFARILIPLAIAVALPLAAQAQTTDSSSLSALLSQIAALQQELAALSGGTSASAGASASASTPAASPSTAGASCPALYRTLSIGSSGSDVASLQTFLIEKGFLQASATGYYGNLTQNAVAAWQQSAGVVSGGDANSTGLGVVGPKTRAAIATSCSGSAPASAATTSSKQCLPVSPPQTDCPNTWQPVLDAAGCTMYYQCSIALPGTGTSASATTSSSAGTSPQTCPFVPKPSCTGTVTPFQTNASGCVTAYQCSI